MNQNVTLSINSNVLQQASDYARSKGTDLSELVENLLKQVTGSKQKRLVGVVRLDEKKVGLDGEINRTEHLEEE